VRRTKCHGCFRTAEAAVLIWECSGRFDECVDGREAVTIIRDTKSSNSTKKERGRNGILKKICVSPVNVLEPIPCFSYASIPWASCEFAISVSFLSTRASVDVCGET